LKPGSERVGTASRPSADRAHAEARACDAWKPDDHLVMISDPDAPGAEAYRSLRNLVERMAEGRSSLVLAITSPGPGDGKTTTAINLAAALAEDERGRVLLVDADLRRSGVTAGFGLRVGERKGLTDRVDSGALSLDDVAVPSPRRGLDLLLTGSPTRRPYEVLQSEAMNALVEDCRRRYRFVVVDAPPVVSVSDCRVIERWVDGFLVVVRAGHTKREWIEETLRVLDPEKVAGVLFNATSEPAFRYAYEAYAAEPRRSWMSRWFRRSR
jgi:capsular exopolysaccharide synthesis family protein